MKIHPSSMISEQNGQGENFPRFMAQSYVAHLINVAIAICLFRNLVLQIPDVGD
jgi:hypothetical protein